MASEQQIQRGEKAARDIDRITEMIRRMSEGTVPLAEGFLDEATRTLARLEPLRDGLAQRLSHPTGRWHHRNVDLMCRMAQAMKRGAELSLEASKANVDLLGQEDAALAAIRVAGTEPAFMRERCKLQTALAEYIWLQNANGIDTLLRAFGESRTIEPQSPEEEATRARWAQELKAAAAADASLQQLVTGLASELEEAKVYLEWALNAEPRLAALEGDMLKAAVADPDWAKFFGSVRVLLSLDERVRAHAGLSKHFPATGSQLQPAGA